MVRSLKLIDVDPLVEGFRVLGVKGFRVLGF